MARTKQKLINFHSPNTSGTSVFAASAISYGEIAVRHNPAQPELYVRTGENTYAVFVDLAKTQGLIDAAAGGINNGLADLSAATQAFSGEVKNNYAKKSETGTAYTNATAYTNTAYSNATAYTKTVSGNIKTALGGYATTGTTSGLDNRVQQLEAFSGEVKTNYAKKSETGTAYTNATSYTSSQVSTAYNNATAYTNTVSGNIKTALGGYATTGTTSGLDNRVQQLEAFSGEVKTNYAKKSETGTAYTNATSYAASQANTAYSSATAYTKTVSGNIKTALGGYATTGTTTAIDNRVTQLSGAVQEFSAGAVSYINNKLSNVYIYQGSVDVYENLSAFTGTAVVGDVYNVIAAHGTTPAGTNYAWNGTQWDALGGSVDLSVYTLTATTALIDNRVQQLEAFSGEVKTNYAKKSETGTAYTNATSYTSSQVSTAYNNATAYTKTVSGNIKTALGGYATTGTTSGLDNRVQQLEAFSGEVKTNYAKKSETGTAYTNATSYTSSQVSTAYNNATAYTNTVSGNIKTALGGYATTGTTSGLDNRVQQLEAFSGEVKTNYAKKSETGTAYTNATSYTSSQVSTAYNNATAYTNTVSGNIKTALGGYATTGTTTAIDNRVTQLSGATQGIETTANSALQGYALGSVSTGDAHYSTQSGAKTSYTAGGTAKLDLSALEIDCGDF